MPPKEPPDGGEAGAFSLATDVTMQDLDWHNDKRRLGDLIPWEQNPRQIRVKDAERLGESLELFGQVQTIAIDPDGEIVDGHQRKHVWSALEKYGPDYEVDVRVANRKLTERERQQLSVYLHEGAVGEWDFDGLANWDVEVEELLDWGFTPFTLGLAAEEIDYDEMWEGMPEYTQDDIGAVRSINVHFRNSNDVKLFADLTGCSITEETKWIWYPHQPREDLTLYRCQDES